MTRDEAMKLALEALVCLKKDFDADQFEWEIADEAITALREALAEQPAQRTWVGLTLQDREALCDRFGGWNYPGILVDAIFDMIKEKNA